MTTSIRNGLPLLLLLAGQMAFGQLEAATASDEELAYNAAARFFQDKIYDRAAAEFNSFVSRFPTSKRVPDALLAEAQARFELRQYTNVISLLTANFNRAEKSGDYFRFWIGEAYYQQGKYGAAATNYRLVLEYPTTFLQAQASYSEAMAWFKQGNVTNTIALLSDPGRPFYKAAQSQTNDLFVLRGYLLLGEALMQQHQYRRAEEALNTIAHRSLPPELAWQRQYLLVRTELADERSLEAVNNLTNLLTVATNTGSAFNLSQSLLLQGQVLEAAHQTRQAIEVYERTLPSLTPEGRHQALLKLVELNLSLTNSAQAIKHLEALVTQFPHDAALDQTLLSLGELRLGEFHTLQTSAAKTNQALLKASALALQQALTNLDLLVTGTNFAKSPLLGQAQLDRGWCFWEAGKIAESLAAFKDAAERLPPSTNQALARFKWAECQCELKDYAGALGNCRAIVNQYGPQTGFPKPLLEQTLYEIVKTSTSLMEEMVKAGTPPKAAELDEATTATDRILTEFKGSQYGDRSLLLLGQLLNHLGKPAVAREKLERLVKEYPRSALMPEVRLALARSFVQERKWPEAITNYDDWLKNYTNHGAIAQVEFDRAWANDQAGRETNALRLFGSFVVHFPKHPLAPVARYWIGDYYYNLGRLGDQANFVGAETNYQLVYQNWPRSELTDEARLAAGRAAFAGQRINNATNDFIALIEMLRRDTNSPPEVKEVQGLAHSLLLWQAYIALGDVFRTLPSTDATNDLRKFAEAINAYGKVPDSSPLAPRAQALIGDCQLQMGHFSEAAEKYLSVITDTNPPTPDIETRSEAEFGLATVFETQSRLSKSPTEQAALLRQAWDHYANVAYRKNLRPGEQPDPYWLAKAGLEAGRLLDSQAKWTQSVNLYQRLLAELPSSLTDTLQKRLEQAKSHLE